MVTLSPGKIRGLTTTSTAGGIFTILALDHRDSLRVFLQPDAPDAIPAADITAVKMWLLAGLGDLASGVMLDPEYAAPQAIAERVLPGGIGFIAPLEAQGYLGDPTSTMTLMEDWDVAKAKRLGAGGVKLLVLYRPDHPNADAHDELIAGVVAGCARHDIPLFLEPLLYRTDADGEGFAARRRGIVVETVRRLGALGPEVLKVPFPEDVSEQRDRGAWQEACEELDEASPVPWALLSGGGSFEAFRDQVEVACRAGASGFMVGRALWGEAVRTPSAEREALIASSLRPRFAELAGIAVEHGTDWAERHELPAAGAIDEVWYRGY